MKRCEEIILLMNPPHNLLITCIDVCMPFSQASLLKEQLEIHRLEEEVRQREMKLKEKREKALPPEPRVIVEEPKQEEEKIHIAGDEVSASDSKYLKEERNKREKGEVPEAVRKPQQQQPFDLLHEKVYRYRIGGCVCVVMCVGGFARSLLLLMSACWCGCGCMCMYVCICMYAYFPLDIHGSGRVILNIRNTILYRVYPLAIVSICWALWRKKWEI